MNNQLENGARVAIVTGLMGGAFLSAWEPIVVSIGAAVAMALSMQYKVPVIASSRASTIGYHPPVQPENEALLRTDERVALYKKEDWDFTKPDWKADITQQHIYRPTAERTIEPLNTRQEFIKFWARDSDDYARKDRYCVARPKDTHQP